MDKPWFSAPVTALLNGFECLENSAGLEINVLSCTRHRMHSAQKLSPNVFFHSVYVPKLGWMRTLYLGCIRAVRDKLKQVSPDIVHGQGAEKDCAMEAAFSGFPNVCTIHGNMRLIARVEKAPLLSYNWLAAAWRHLPCLA